MVRLWWILNQIDPIQEELNEQERRLDDVENNIESFNTIATTI